MQPTGRRMNTVAIWVRILFAAMVIAATFAQASGARAVLQPGQPAPPFTKKTTAGKPFALDAKSRDTVMLVFVKPADLYAQDALKALEAMFAKCPPLLEGMRVAVVLCRVAKAEEARAFEKKKATRWPVIVDEGDELYRNYLIVATPTVLVVDAGRKVAAVHPGYDLGMVDVLRSDLARVRGVTLPREMTGPAEKPNMTLQLGRRMAARGLWESALKYYTQAEKQGPLSPQAQLELAEIQVEMGQVEQGLALLGKLPAALRQGEAAARITKRAAEIKAGKKGLSKPPSVVR